MARSAEVEVVYDKGVYLPFHDLWLDPQGRRRVAFVSHAHSDHIGRHDVVILTEATQRLMRARLGGKREEYVLPFLRPILESTHEGAAIGGGMGEGLVELPMLPGVRLGLLPAGHILGSSQLYLETEAGSLLYTGDFKLRHGLAAEPLMWRHAETLIMETTFGLPRFQFPPAEEVLAQVVAFCRAALEREEVPVLLSYSLGKSQEAVCALARAGLTPVLQSAVYKMTKIYSELSPAFPGGSLLYHEGHEFDCGAGHVLIAPPRFAGLPMVQRLNRHKTAVLTGWAIDPSARYRYRTDAAFPLSDHAGYDDLLRYVEMVQPKRVLTHHGYSAAFASDLRERGVEAWALNAGNQLTLGL